MVHGHTVAAVIVAAGASRRMGFDKLAYQLDGGTVLEKSVRAFDTHPAIDEILLVAGENAPQAALLAAACAKPAKTVAGGATRVQSVRAGLDAVQSADTDHEIVFFAESIHTFRCGDDPHLLLSQEVDKQCGLGSVTTQP